MSPVALELAELHPVVVVDLVLAGRMHLQDFDEAVLSDHSFAPSTR